MNLNISREWLLRMAEKEDNGIVSVGGLVARVDPKAFAKAAVFAICSIADIIATGDLIIR